MKVFDLAISHLDKKKPFVFYSLPESDTIVGYFQKNNELNHCLDFTKSGFVFAPFNYLDKTLFIPKDESSVIEEVFQTHDVSLNGIKLHETSSEKKTHTDLVENAIKYIDTQNLKKIVVSRKKEVDLERIDYLVIFERLFSLYPSAFRYVWFHPQTGFWCGATPEILLQTKDLTFTTMALAGTKKIVKDKKPHWTAKEILEQRFVKESILKILENVTTIVRASKTYNHKAGQVVHLRTDITGVFNRHKTNLLSITKALHPTPAVCGTPRDEALRFIIKNEDYNREFYTGFLGNVCEESTCSDFFVNLRCMKITNNTVSFYAGGGITFDSNPLTEWEETQNKLQTMTEVVAPFLC